MYIQREPSVIPSSASQSLVQDVEIEVTWTNLVV